MSAARDIVKFACKVRPDQATLVPEKRRELTTEGGLDVRANEAKIESVVARLLASGIDVSLFIDPVKTQIDASVRTGARIIELHTGEYASAKSEAARKMELDKTRSAAAYALSLGIEVNAGHGLDYENTKRIAEIKGINELNIGYSIICRAIFVGLGRAVEEMMELVR